MSILADVRYHLDSSEDVRNLVGKRIYVGRTPLGVKRPVVVLQRISTNREYTLVGEIGQVMPIVQVDIYAETHLQEEDIAEAVRNRMSGYTGLMNATDTHGCTIERDNQIAIRPDDGSDRWIYRRSLDFKITHDQPIPTLT